MPIHRTTACLVAIPLLLLGGCEEPEPPALTVGTVEVPESAIANLSDTERQMLFDLIGLADAVGRQQTDSLVEPIVRREAESSLIAALPVHLGARALGLSEDSLRAAYAHGPEWELVVRHVVRLAEAGDPQMVHDSARAVARRVAERAAAGDDFPALAAEFSEEPGAARRGGLLEPGRRGSWVEPFWEAASGLRPGELSDVIQTEYGYHVLKLEERRPVPFEEANRTDLLRRIVPAEAAAAAMEAWASSDGLVLLDPPALQHARELIDTGSAIPDTLVIARGAGGGEFRGHQLAAGWARLQPEERDGAEAAFADWVQGDAREAIWATHARGMGVEEDAAATAAARAEWRGRVAGWAQTFAFGFGTERPDPQTVQAARNALLSGAPDARAARRELRSLRPLLRKTATLSF